MDITIDNAELLPALSLVNNVIERQQTLPILANLLFEVSDKHLTLVGTNFEIELTRRLPQAMDGPDGAFTVAARKIVDICRNLPKDGKVRLNCKDDVVTVTCGRSRFSLKTLPAAEFTRVDSQAKDATPLDWEERFEVPAAEMDNLLRRTSFAMGKNDPRFYLNGALIELAKTGIKMVATNSHRLAQSEFKQKLELSTEPRQLIVPRKAITELQHLLDQNDDNKAKLQISVSSTHLKIVCGDSTLISKLIDASYPEFQSVLDKFDEATRVPLPRQEMVDALTRVSVMTAERFNGVRLAFAPEEMTISARNQENEEADEKLSVEYTGQPLESGYNVTYLLDIFRTATDEQLDFFLQSEQGICFIRPPETPDTLWLVMPMRI